MSTVIKDKSSIEWLSIKGFYLTRLNELRVENDADLNPVETARLRGMIELAKEILSLDETEEKIVVPEQTYIE